MNEIICKECEKIIDVNLDQHVLLGTYNGDHVLDESYYHYVCFKKWYDHKVSEKAKNSVSTIQNKIQGLMKNPKIAGIMSMIGGVDKLKGMLNTNLDTENVENLIKDFMPEIKPDENINNDDDGKKGKPKVKPKKKKMQ